MHNPYIDLLRKQGCIDDNSQIKAPVGKRLMLSINWGGSCPLTLVFDQNGCRPTPSIANSTSLEIDLNSEMMTVTSTFKHFETGAKMPSIVNHYAISQICGVNITQ
jgi:hypothetical protein